MTDGPVEFIDVTLDELVRYLNGEAFPVQRSRLTGDPATTEAHPATRGSSSSCRQSASQTPRTDFVLVEDLSEIEGSFLLELLDPAAGGAR